MKHYFFLFVCSILLLACTKEKGKSFCWNLIDQFGNITGSVCDKTEDEMKRIYPDPCSYYKQDGEKFCWLINGQSFVRDRTEDEMNKAIICQGISAVKVNCETCKNFYSRLKQTYKPTSFTYYSSVTYSLYCGDTATKLFHGREVIIKDTPDSLISIQFSSTGQF